MPRLEVGVALPRPLPRRRQARMCRGVVIANPDIVPNPEDIRNPVAQDLAL